MAGVIDFNVATTPVESYRPDPNRVLSGDPVQTAQVLYTSADGKFVSGIWTSQPGKWRVAFTEHEFCQLVEGAIAVTDDTGRTRTFRAGDAFVTPSGFSGVWDVLEPAKKTFAVYEP